MPQISNNVTDIYTGVDYQPQDCIMIRENVNFPSNEIERFLNQTFRRSRFRAYYISSQVLTDIQNIINNNSFHGLVFHYGINNNGQFNLVISFFKETMSNGKYNAEENPNPIFSTNRNSLPFFSTSTNTPGPINTNISNVTNINSKGLYQHPNLIEPNILIANFDDNIFLKSTPIFSNYSGFILGNVGLNNIITEMGGLNQSGILVQFGIQEVVESDNITKKHYLFSIFDFGKIKGNLLTENRSVFWTSRGLYSGGPTNPPNGVPQVPQP